MQENLQSNINNDVANNQQQNSTQEVEQSSDYCSAMVPNFERRCMDIISDRDVFKNVCDLIEVKEIITPLDFGSRKIKLQSTDEDGETTEYIVPMSALKSRESLYNDIIEDGFILGNPNFATHLSSYISTEVRKAMKKKASYTHYSIGWLEVDGEWCFCLDTIIGSSKNSKSTRKLKFKKGDEQAYFDFIDNTIMKTIPWQTAFALGLTPVVASRIREHTGIEMMFLDVLGGSSTGKSTMQHFVTSLFSDANISHKNLFRTFNATANAMIAANSQINGVCINIDDCSSVGKDFNWDKFIYEIASGSAKSRCKKEGSLDDADEKSWSGMMEVTSEVPLVNDETLLGATARLLVADNIKWTASANEAKEIKSFCKQNYGHVGPKFVAKLIKKTKQEGNISFLEYAYTNEVDKIKQLFEETDNVCERVIDQLGLIALTCDLIEEFLGYKLEKDKILDIFIKREKQEVQKRKYDEAAQAFDIVKENIVKNMSRLKKYREEKVDNCIGTIKTKGDKTTYSVLATTVSFWLTKFQDTQKIFQQWAEDGLIIKTNEKKHEYKPKDTWLTGNARVVSFNLDKDNLNCWDEIDTKYHSSTNT